jgi:hypothetical protein
MGALLTMALLALAPHARATLPPGAEVFAELGLGGMRGVTLGPIENARHPGKGYGTEASLRALSEARRMGATWVSITPFGRVWDLRADGVDLSFEAPFDDNREAVLAVIAQAHALGLKVFVVPHLWVESGGWRALIDPGSDAGWQRWARSYRRFLLAWAEVRALYPGLLTYSANWDDLDDTLLWDELDLVGVNAFYPLAFRDGASQAELIEGGQRVADGLATTANAWRRPVVLTEVGYTTRKDPAVRPWEWPDGMKDVVVDERAQAEAYVGILAPMLDARFCAGWFVWRLYADPDDVSQEAEWGFSPRGKLAELVLRDAFTAPWAADGPRSPGAALGRHRARTPGVHGWELSPDPREVWTLASLGAR